jgi:hypothetical protein
VMLPNDDMWAFDINFAEPTEDDLLDTARVVLSFSALQRTALKHFLMGLALSWPRKYAALMSYLQVHGFRLACKVRREHNARVKRMHRRAQTEQDVVSKMLKGTILRKNKTFHTKNVALDAMGVARLINKDYWEVGVDGRDPLARGSQDPIPIPHPFREDPNSAPDSDSDVMSNSDEDEESED